MQTQLAGFDSQSQPRPSRFGGRARVNRSSVTSVQLSTAERELLEQLAAAAAVPLGEVWRRALRAYAMQLAASGQETERAPM